MLDISKQGGGKFGKHGSHQNGRDVDIRYVRSDGKELPYNFDLDSAPYPGFDKEKTQELMDLFIGQGATRIYADERTGLTGDGIIKEYSGHQHHFHVRFN